MRNTNQAVKDMKSEARPVVSNMDEALVGIGQAQFTDDYQKLVEQLAGPVYPQVKAVFPAHLQLVYLVTDVGRRHAWNIVLFQQDKGMSRLEAARLRAKLATQKASDLLQSVYFVVPAGFTSLLKRFGPNAQSEDVYDMLHEMANCNPKLARELSHRKELTGDLIESLHSLPDDMRSLRLATSMGSKEAVAGFVQLVDYLGDMPEERERLRHHIACGSGVPSVLHDIYLRLPFGEPAMPDDDKVRSLKTGYDMIDAAKRFDNCLADEVPKAMRADRQYYEWMGDTPAIVSLRRYRDRWGVDEIKTEGNESPHPSLRKQIHAHFAEHGVTSDACMRELLEHYLLKATYMGDLFESPINTDFYDMEYCLNND